MTRSAFGKEFLKPLSVCFCPRERLVSIDAAIQPTGMALDHFAVLADLCGKRMQHGILAGRNTGIGCDPRRFGLCRNGKLNLFYDSFHSNHPLLVVDILPLKVEYIQGFQRNIVHEFSLYFLAMIVSIFRYSDSVMMPFERSSLTIDIVN